jgi:hypothetical protein
LVPGSPEAVEADRKKDRLRKKQARQADPAPLPSARPGEAVSVSSSPPPGGLGTQLVPAPAPLVPWTAEAVQPVVDQFLPAAETMMVNQIARKAVRARLPQEIVAEIKKDAAWPADARRALQSTGGALGAKYLNKLGISAEYGPEIAFVTAVSRIAAGHVLLLRRLNLLIRKANVPPVRPGEKVKGNDDPKN